MEKLVSWVLKTDRFIKARKLLSFFKGALEKYNIFPNFFQKKVGIFYAIRSIGMGNDFMLSFTSYRLTYF